MERVNVNAVDDSGAYYKLSVFLDMSSDRTKVFFPFLGVFLIVVISV